MTDEAAKAITIVLWLAIPTVLVVADIVFARVFYGIWRQAAGRPGSRFVSVMMVTISIGAIAQALAVANAYRIVLLGASAAGGVAATLGLYFLGQILNAIAIAYKTIAIYKIASRPAAPATDREA